MTENSSPEADSQLKTLPVLPAKQINSVATAISTFLKDVLPSLPNLAVIVGISGFIVVQSYLAKYTHIFTYSLSAGQYIGAGIGSLVIVFLGIVIGLAIILIGALGFSIFWELLHLIWSIFTPKKLTAREFVANIWKNSREIAFEPIGGRVLRYLYFFSIVIASILISVSYGQAVYPLIPRALGGGVPAKVILIFKESTSAAWQSIRDPAQPFYSRPVLLIAELSDGVLISNNGIAIEVKNDVLSGILDALPNVVSPTTTNVPTVTLSPPTLSPQLTPTH